MKLYIFVFNYSDTIKLKRKYAVTNNPTEKLENGDYINVCTENQSKWFKEQIDQYFDTELTFLEKHTIMHNADLLRIASKSLFKCNATNIPDETITNNYTFLYQTNITLQHGDYTLKDFFQQNFQTTGYNYINSTTCVIEWKINEESESPKSPNSI